MATAKTAKPAPKKMAASPALVAVPASKQVMFATDPKSPFSDGYSIDLEKAQLAEFLSDEARMLDEHDPMYERYIELVDREDRLEAMKASYTSRKGAEPVVDQKEAGSMNFLGALVDEQVDQMALHTKEGFRLFMGRARDPEKSLQPIIGGKRVAASLRALWMLTANDNPFADWGLLRHEQSIRQVQDKLDAVIASAQRTLDQQKARGLTFSVLQSSSPQILNLGFKSPWGYAIAQLVSSFDYFVRVMKTLERKNLRTDAQVRQAITEMTRIIRRVFVETARYDRWLMREEMKGLCRADFIPGTVVDPDSAKRAEFATAVFGPCPSEVFSGQAQPSHSRRRLQISPAERNLLQQVSAQLLQKEQAMAAEAAAADAAVLDEADAKLV